MTSGAVTAPLVVEIPDLGGGGGSASPHRLDRRQPQLSVLIGKHQAPAPAAQAVDPTEVGSASELAEHFTVFSDPIDAVGAAVGATGNYIGIRADYEDATPGHARAKDDDHKDAGAEHTSTSLGAAAR